MSKSIKQAQKGSDVPKVKQLVSGRSSALSTWLYFLPYWEAIDMLGNKVGTPASVHSNKIKKKNHEMLMPQIPPNFC